MGRRQTPSLPGLPKWRCGCLLAPTWPGHLPGFSHEEKKKRRGAWPEARKVADRAQQVGVLVFLMLLYDWYLLPYKISFAICFQYNELCLKLLTVPCCCVKRGPVILLCIWRLLLRICFPSFVRSTNLCDGLLFDSF
jgi:hypothetical protein